MKTISLTALLVLIITATCLAASPVKGAKYSGVMTDSSTSALSFKVSKDGKTVSGLRLATTPNNCASGGESPDQSSRPAAIGKGKFRAKVRFKTTDGAVFATAKVTGRFVGRRGARGTVTTKFKDAESQACNGTFDYTAKAG